MAAASHRDGGRGLEREMVVTEALQLLEEVGFGGLTVRKLAERLQVQAAALYWHFENKQDLIDALAERIMMAEFVRARPSGNTDWRNMLAMVARTHRQALMRYRDGAEVMAHANLRSPKMMEGLERLLRELHTQGFSGRLAMASFFTIIRFTIGCVFEEQADPRTGQPNGASRADRLKELALQYPTFAAGLSEVMVGDDKGTNYLFECGLRVILDGIAVQVEKPA